MTQGLAQKPKDEKLGAAATACPNITLLTPFLASSQRRFSSPRYFSRRLRPQQILQFD
jgi:hypothetical protein